jgi:hypothetical protein
MAGSAQSLSVRELNKAIQLLVQTCQADPKLRRSLVRLEPEVLERSFD